ncbi:MAG TPA: AAA family ATPase [Acidimicrobiales bacterium]
MQEPTLGGPPEEPKTRPPMPLWDRTKILMLFVGVWLVLVWNSYIDIQLLGGGIVDAINEQLEKGTFWLFLAWLEVIRQLHYMLSERWEAWHGFWSQRVFGGFTRRVERFDDWNRFRMARAFKWVLMIAVGAYLLGQVYGVPASQALFELPSAVWDALPFIVQIVFILFVAVMQFVAIFWFLSRGGVEVYMPNDIKTRFSDVWGQDSVLDRVKENLLFLESPEKIEEKGGYVPGGILLWGPPGTGKTLLAEAAAGETGKPFVFVEPAAFIQMFMGVGPMKVKALFRKLRKLSLRYGGVVVFFDEADSLGNRGSLSQGGWNNATPWDHLTQCNGIAYQSPATQSLLLAGPARSEPNGRRPLADRIIMGGMGMGAGSGALQALLAEISGLKKPRGLINRYGRRILGMRPKPPPKYRMLIMMATNMPHSLDEALLRPGRIDRIYKVGYPSKEGRRRTFEGYLSKISHELTDEDVDKLATISPYATGASIKDMVNEALVIAFRDERDTVTWADIILAKRLKEHGLPDDSQYVDRERHATAVHEACHAIAAYRLRSHDIIDIATIERRGDIGGFVSYIPPEDIMFSWKTERETDIIGSLASLAGERMFYDGDNSIGVGGDLSAATRNAMLMVGMWGMGDRIASRTMNLSRLLGSQGSMEDGTDRQVLDTPFGEEVEALLARLYGDTCRLLEANRFEVLAVAHALETHKTMSGDDVAAIVENKEGPLVDGRVYHEPGAREALEEYHRHAVEAHVQHGRVAADLPVLVAGSANGHAGEAGAAADAGDGADGANGNGSRRRRRRTEVDPPS